MICSLERIAVDSEAQGRRRYGRLSGFGQGNLSARGALHTMCTRPPRCLSDVPVRITLVDADWAGNTQRVMSVFSKQGEGLLCEFLFNVFVVWSKRLLNL